MGKMTELAEMNKDIVEWHKKTFPDCSVETQLLKLDEELKELIDCILRDDDKDSELADVYIVSLVLARRYNSTIGNYFMGLFSKDPLVLEAVKKKMEINKKRVWIKVDGQYRHKGDE